MRLSSEPRKSPTDAPSGMTGNPARDLANSFNVQVILFLLLHFPLAFIMEKSPLIGTIHGGLVLLFGLRAALLGRTSQVVYAVTYIAAAEVLWRMSRSFLFWEFSKYAIMLVIFVALVVELSRRGSMRRFRTVWPLLLMVTLIPAAVMAIMYYSPAEARDVLSFNLSGHAALIALGLYLWGRPLNRETTIRMLLALIAPTVGITFLAIYFTITALDSLIFIGASNWVTSGNYGPNQVSNMMGLGALAGTMLFVLIPRAWVARIFILLTIFAMLVQGLLTFSRGGIYSFGLALAAFGLHLTTTPRARRRFLALFVLFGAALLMLIYPFLEDFTGGSFSQRFADLDTTGRLEVALTDVELFLDNPVVGVGVGRSTEYHDIGRSTTVAAHTEFTRLLAEHGLFGILAIAIIVYMLVKQYLANHSGLARAMTAALAVWSMSTMLHSGTRLAVIPLTIALALAMWRLRAHAAEPAEEPALTPRTSRELAHQLGGRDRRSRW